MNPFEVKRAKLFFKSWLVILTIIIILLSTIKYKLTGSALP